MAARPPCRAAGRAAAPPAPLRAGTRPARRVSAVSGAPARPSLLVVERRVRNRVWLLFLLLLAVVSVLTLGAAALAAALVAAADARLTLGDVLWSRGALLVALVVTVGLTVAYWVVVRLSGAGRILRQLRVRPPDPGDPEHHRFANVVEEVAVASGGLPLRPLVVPGAGIDGFAVSDLGRGGWLALTEGAISRLSRAQLQGVVAHLAA